VKPKTATASFRVDKSALEALHEDAKRQSVSVNTLLNQLLLTYAAYDRPMARFQMVKISSSTLRYILQAASDEALAEAGEAAGNNVPMTYILAKWGRVTVENCLEYLKTTSAYAKLFDYSESINEGTRGVTLSHNFGAKGTLFLQHYVRAILAPVGKEPKFSSDLNAVTFTLQ
jgi:hypothetical protein